MFELLPLGWWWITKIPIKIHQFSHAWSLTPLISSLCSPFARSSSHASHLFSLLCPLRGKSLCSVIRLIFFLFFFFLSSSSSTRTDLVLFYFILFLSNMVWEIRFEGRDLINKTPSNTDLLPKTTRYQHWSKFFFFLSSVGNFFSDLACFVLANDLFVLLLGTENICGYMLFLPSVWFVFLATQK